MAKKTVPTKASETELTPDTIPDPFSRAGLAEWFDRWPEMFGRRWPDLRHMPFGGETFSMEQFVEEDGTLVLRAELPGLTEDDDVSVTVDEGRLTISGKREERTETREKDSFRSEFRYGSFERTVRLPAGAHADDIAATYDDGILEVRVPVDADGETVTTVPIKNRS